MKKALVQTLALLLLFAGISQVQQRHMLPSDGSVHLLATPLVSLDERVLPLYQAGKPTVVYAFAPWCQICAASVGNLTEVPADWQVALVAFDYQSVEEVNRFASKHKLERPVLLGTQALRQQLKVTAYPSYYLLDKEGKVIDKTRGYTSSVGLRLRAWWAAAGKANTAQGEL